MSHAFVHGQSQVDGVEDQAAPGFRSQGVGFDLDQSFLGDLFGLFHQVQLQDPFPAHGLSALVEAAALAVAFPHSSGRQHGRYPLGVEFQAAAQGGGKNLLILVHHQIKHRLADAFKGEHGAVDLQHQLDLFLQGHALGIDAHGGLIFGDIAALGSQTKLFCFVYRSGKDGYFRGPFYCGQYGLVGENIGVGKAPGSVFEKPHAVAVKHVGAGVLQAQIAQEDHLVGGFLNADVGIFGAQALSRVHGKIGKTHTSSSGWRAPPLGVYPMGKALCIYIYSMVVTVGMSPFSRR